MIRDCQGMGHLSIDIALSMSWTVSSISSNYSSLAYKSDGSIWIFGPLKKGFGLVAPLKLQPGQDLLFPRRIIDGIYFIHIDSYRVYYLAEGNQWAWIDSNILGWQGDGTRENRQKPVKIMKY
jgi:hypothetical protein